MLIFPMKPLLVLMLTTCTLPVFAQKGNGKSPLARYSKEWSQPKYKACNTAAGAKYLTAEEKEVIWILNMARMDPQLFRNTILRRAYEIASTDTFSDTYFRTLDAEMAVMKPLPVQLPDSVCALSAKMHAVMSGKTNYAGHERNTPESRKVQCYGGECCHYGGGSPLRIVLSLLVDQDVPSLGHRKICFGSYARIGVGIAPHLSYGSNAVLDFVR